MFWRLFVKDIPSLDSALEGIVWKEGKGRFFKRFWKKRLLAYDEVAKCLRYYTPQRVLKGTIFLCDILFITPGRSSGRDIRKDSVFEITIPGRVYVFHVNNIRETKKWIGILSRELDTLQIRDRIQLNNGNIKEGTYSKTLRPNSAILSSLKIGDHREHEECCFLFDEEHQHRIIALESLCSLQAMKIYELSHSVEKFQRKCDDLETPPSEEIKKLKRQYNKLRVNFEREKLQVLDLKATIEEHEEQKEKEKEQNRVQIVQKHQHMDFMNVKVMHIEKGEASNRANTKSDKSRMEELQKLQAELEHTKALLAQERERALASPLPSVNFNSPSPSPLFFDTRVTTTTTTTMSGAINPTRSPTMPSRTLTPTNVNSGRLQSIPENAAINKLQTSYKTFSPATITSAYLDYHANTIHRENSPFQRAPSPPQRENTHFQRTPSPLQRDHSPFQLSHPPASPKPQKSQQPAIHSSAQSDTTPILSPQPRYPPSVQPISLDPPSKPTTPILQQSDISQSTSSQGSDWQSTSSLDLPPTNTVLHKGLHNSNNAISSSLLGDFNVVSVTTNSTATTSSNTSSSNTTSNITSNTSSNTSSTTVSTSLLKSTLSSSAGLSRDFNMVATNSPGTKLRSYSESHGTTPPFKNLNQANRPNGKLANDRSMPEMPSPRSRTNSNPPTFKYSLSSSTISSSMTKSDSITLSSKFGAEFAELLAAQADDNGFSVQVVAKLNEAMAEITALGAQLQAEREKVKSLMEEKAHMLDTMEDMTAERTRNKKFKDEMEDLMEATEGKLNTMREALEIEIQLRMAAEAKLNQLAQAQLQQSILHADMPPNKPDILQPLLTNYSH
jgi:uncharacterized coiled-coil protein SlyX